YANAAAIPHMSSDASREFEFSGLGIRTTAQPAPAAGAYADPDRRGVLVKSLPPPSKMWPEAPERTIPPVLCLGELLAPQRHHLGAETRARRHTLRVLADELADERVEPLRRPALQLGALVVGSVAQPFLERSALRIGLGLTFGGQREGLLRGVRG